MTVSLGQMQQIGSFAVVALTDTTITAQQTKQSITVLGHKAPVAILLRQGTTLLAFSPDGSPLSKDDIDKLSPGAWQEILTASG